MDAWLTSTRRDDRLSIEAGGRWILAALPELDARRAELLLGVPGGGRASIDLQAIQRLDTAGAWLLDRMAHDLDRQGWQIEWSGARDAHAALLAEIQRLSPAPLPPAPQVNPLVRLVAELGRSTLAALGEAARLLSFYGQTVAALATVVVRPRRLRLTSLTHHLEQTCVNASADRRPDLLSDRHRDGLSGRRSAAALRGGDLHDRPARRSPRCARSGSSSPRWWWPAAPAARSPPRSA